MKNMTFPILSGFLLAALALQPAWGADNPQPGTINYLEGQASVNGRALNDKSIGSVRLDPGQTLATQNGRAEMLLTPGIFLREGDHSAVQMVSPGLADTVVTVQQGRALVEAANLLPANNIVVNAAGMSVRLLKPGLYDFDTAHGAVRVFDGKAEVRWNGGDKQLTSDHEIAFGPAGRARPEKFQKTAFEDDFYRWSSLRSSYMMEANVDAAGRYANQPQMVTTAWAGTGWYWDPWFDSYAFIPGDGVFFSPFGWGFYSPWAVWGAPIYGWGGGFWGGAYHHFGHGYHPPAIATARGFHGHAGHIAGSSFGHTPSRGFTGGNAFHGGSPAFHGVGFAGGGMHGFSGGGGFHGGFHGGGRR
jgi:hypothetical protein